MRSDSCSSSARSQQRSSALHPCRTGASWTQIDARRAGWKAIQDACSVPRLGGAEHRNSGRWTERAHTAPVSDDLTCEYVAGCGKPAAYGVSLGGWSKSSPPRTSPSR